MRWTNCRTSSDLFPALGGCPTALRVPGELEPAVRVPPCPMAGGLGASAPMLLRRELAVLVR
eukprot:15869276-Heterocapsa_arctica.AAC.1